MSAAVERHFTVQQVAELWSLSEDTVRAIFKDVPGVLRIDRPERRHKRGYCSVRIPESVLTRVHQNLRGGAR